MEISHIGQLIDAFVKDIRAKVPAAGDSIWQAFRRVPRHLFIDRYYQLKDGRFTKVDVDKENAPDGFLKMVYGDNGIMIHDPNPRTHSAASQPSLVAMMLHYLDVKAGLRILEIGTGSGWSAGLMASIIGEDGLVASIDMQPELVRAARSHLVSAGLSQVELLATDGASGWAERSPFDRIIATVGCPEIPAAWFEQLGDGGVLLVPFKTAPIGDPLLRLAKQGDSVSGRFVGSSWFMTLQGAPCTDREDAIIAPWDSEIEALLSRAPTIETLSHPLDMDVLFFAYLCGMELKTLIDQTRRQGPSFSLFDLGSRTITVPDSKEPVVRIYGDKAKSQRWSELIERWSIVGKPKLGDYLVELPHGGNQESTHTLSWKKQRAYNLYEFSLPEAG